jgi:hypothetical protein
MEKHLRVAILGGSSSQRDDLAGRIQTGSRCQVVVSVPLRKATVPLIQEAQPALVFAWLELPMVEVMDLVQRVIDVCPRAAVWLVGDSPPGTYTPLAQRWGAIGYLHWQSLEAQLEDLITKHVVRNT